MAKTLQFQSFMSGVKQPEITQAKLEEWPTGFLIVVLVFLSFLFEKEHLFFDYFFLIIKKKKEG